MTQENTKLIKQLESGFKRTINWNKYLAKTTNRAQSRYFKLSNWSSFSRIKFWLLAFSFKDDAVQETHKQYFLPTVEIKDDNVMIDGRNFFDKLIKNNLKTYDNID